MNILVAGGTGFIGRFLIPALQKDGHKIYVLSRDVKKIKRCFGESVVPLDWQHLEEFLPEKFDSIINLSGENIANQRWTSSYKKRIKESRIKTTQTLIQWCIQSKSPKKPHFYNTSAIGIYGLQPSGSALPTALTEENPTPLISDFLSEIGHAWEEATYPAVDAGLSVTLMRFAVVLKRGEGILKKLTLPFYLGLGSILGHGHQPFSWIHIYDLVNAIIFLLHHPNIIGAVNLSAPNCVSQKNFAMIFANTLNRPLFLHLSDFLIQFIFGEMGNSLLLNGQNVYPKKLIKEKFSFTFPTLSSALQHEWQKQE